MAGRQRQADPPGPCVTGRGRTRSHSPGCLLGGARPQPGHPNVSSPFPLRIEVQQCSFSRSGPSSVDTGSPGGCVLLSGSGGGEEYRVVHSQDISLLSTLSWALGVRRGRPGCYRAYRRSLVCGGSWGGHGRCTACVAGSRVEGGPGGPEGEEDSMRSEVPATPWASFPSSALPVGFCGSFPWGPRPQPCSSMRRKPGSRGERDCGALHCRSLQFLPWFGLQTTPKNAVAGIWSKPPVAPRGRVRVISCVVPSRSRARLTSGRQPTLRDAASHRPARRRPGTPWGQAETRVCPRQPSRNIG